MASERLSGRTGRPPKLLLIESLRTRAWFRCCAIESGHLTAGALDREFHETFGLSRRAWERYATGRHTPSMGRDGSPGIVRKMAELYPRTLTVFVSPLWSALDTRISFDQAGVDKLLLTLSAEVREQFLYARRDGTVVRDWQTIHGGYWNYPSVDLAMDYLAAYLALLRELRHTGRHDVADLAETCVGSALEVLEQCPILASLSGEIFNFVQSTFLLAAHERFRVI